MAYEITWRRDSDQPTPENQRDGGLREDAVIELLEENDIDTEDITYQPPPRHLTASSQPLFTVCSFAFENIEKFIIVYQFLKQRDDARLVLSQEAEELLERLREQDKVEEIDGIKKES